MDEKDKKESVFSEENLQNGAFEDSCINDDEDTLIEDLGHVESEQEIPYDGGIATPPSKTADGEFQFDENDQGKWYVVHTYSGHENKVKANIEKIVENRCMQNLVLEIIVPTEERVEIRPDGQRKVKTRKIFPGYVLVKMIITNESWYVVRNTQGVTGFVGHGTEPIPLTTDEVRRMGIEKVYVDLYIEVGDNIKVINGPFESFMGVVEEINMEKQTLKAKISMFGRDTPVELEFGQVDKL